MQADTGEVVAVVLDREREVQVLGRCEQYERVSTGGEWYVDVVGT